MTSRCPSVAFLSSLTWSLDFACDVRTGPIARDNVGSRWTRVLRMRRQEERDARSKQDDYLRASAALSVLREVLSSKL